MHVKTLQQTCDSLSFIDIECLQSNATALPPALLRDRSESELSLYNSAALGVGALIGYVATGCAATRTRDELWSADRRIAAATPVSIGRGRKRPRFGRGRPPDGPRTPP